MEQLLQHFRPSEQPFIEQCYRWAEEVDDQYVPKLTPFLNPRQRYILETIVLQRGLQYASEGKFGRAEQQRVLIYPDYYEPTADDFEVTILDVRYPKKFVQLTHREVYGALMNIGIERERFGDVVIEEQRVQIAVASELTSFLMLNFTTVGKTNITLEEATAPYLLNTLHVEERLVFVSSLRLDTLVSEMANVSRQRAAKLIRGEKVKLNWMLVNDPAQTVQLDDMISIRQYGRFYVVRVEGTTKKENIRLVIGKQVDRV